jgi:hypothetical protein
MKAFAALVGFALLASAQAQSPTEAKGARQDSPIAKRPASIDDAPGFWCSCCRRQLGQHNWLISAFMED